MSPVAIAIVIIFSIIGIGLVMSAFSKSTYKEDPARSDHDKSVSPVVLKICELIRARDFNQNCWTYGKTYNFALAENLNARVSVWSDLIALNPYIEDTTVSLHVSPKDFELNQTEKREIVKALASVKKQDEEARELEQQENIAKILAYTPSEKKSTKAKD